jgi:recombination protein RecA
VAVLSLGFIFDFNNILKEINMPRKKKQDSFYSDLAEETGGEVFSDAGGVSYYIDTGNLAINYICSGRFIGGGIPGGRITEVAGPEASGKSLLGYCVMGACQRMGGISSYEDCERAGNADFAKQCGHLDPDTLVCHYPPTIEEVERKVVKTTKYIREKKNDSPLLFVWDSIGVSMTDREWNETNLPDNPTKTQIADAGGLERPGERAKACGKTLRKLNPFLSDNNATLYIVNQLRSKIGVLYGDPDTTSGGGRALPYYASCRLAMGVQKRIECKETGIPIGVNMSIRNKKNRSFKPFLSTKGIQLYFDSGINPLGGLLSILMNAGRIKQSGKGTYQILDPWADGKEYKFKSSKERNDIPLDVLLDCPSLVDGKSVDEIKDYVSIFQEAFDLSTGDNIKEVAANLEEEAMDIVSG